MVDPDRRRFLHESAALGAAIALGSACEPGGDAIGTTARPLPARTTYGYPARASVFQGGVLRLHYWTDQPSLRVKLYRQGLTLQLLHTTAWMTAAQHGGGAPGGATTSWGWPSVDIPLGPTLVPGVYIAALESRDAAGAMVVSSDDSAHGSSGKALFVIRPTAPRARVLYKLSYATYQAYNSTGGPSMYEQVTLGSAPDGAGGTHEGYRVTFLRPGGGTGGDNSSVLDSFDPTSGAASPINSAPHEDLHFVRWFEQRGVAVDYCTDVDVHREEGLLSAYRLLVSGGHDEYWSQEMRDHVDAFVSSGGNVAFFSGNVCWWRIYYADDDGDGYPDAFVCDKRIDGSYGGGDGVDNWWRQRPENATTGVSTRLGGWVYPPPAAGNGYTVQRAADWVFAGAGLADGAVLGQAVRLVNYEFDGLDHEADPDFAGARRPTARDGSPSSFAILGLCTFGGGAVIPGREALFAGLPARATMGHFTRCGTVFTGGTTEWPRALAQGDVALDRITQNVVGALSAPRAVAALSDLDGDGRADLFFSLPLASGTAIGAWRMQGASVIDGGYASRAQEAGWTLVDAADVDGSGTRDLYFHDRASGQLSVWPLAGASRLVAGAARTVARTTAVGWAVVAARDFDGDGSPDLVLTHAASGAIAVWFMSGTTFVREVACDRVQSAAITLVTARDFDGDGRPDLVFYEASTGQVSVWILGGASGVAYQRTLLVARTQDPVYALVAAGDLDGDGRPDLLFQHRTTGQLRAWFLGGTDGMTVVREADVLGGGAFAGWVSQPAGGTLAGDTPTLARGARGELASFARGTDGQIWLNLHSAAASWQGWTVLTGVAVGQRDRVAVTAYVDGRLVALVRATDGVLRYAVQSAANPRAWSSWTAIPGLGLSAGDACACACAGDGRLVVIARRASPPGVWAPHAINWETSAGSGQWRGWQDQPGGGTYPRDTAALATLADGRVASFARGIDGAIYLNAHSFTGVWQRWVVLSGLSVAAGDRVAVGRYADGRLVALVRDTTGVIRAVTQVSAADPFTWGPPRAVPGLSLAAGDPIAVVTASSGRLAVAVRGAGGACALTRESGEGAWFGWASLPGLVAEAGDGFALARAGDGRIAVMNRRAAPGTWAANAIDWEL